MYEHIIMHTYETVCVLLVKKQLQGQCVAKNKK